MITEYSTPDRTSAQTSETAAAQRGEPRVGRSVSLDHAAVLLGVSRRTIYNRIRDGRLQTVRTRGGSQRVLVDSVMETQGSQRHEFPKVTKASR
jgi:excisionase family DNA binding protein